MQSRISERFLLKRILLLEASPLVLSHFLIFAVNVLTELYRTEQKTVSFFSDVQYVYPNLFLFKVVEDDFYPDSELQDFFCSF